MNASPWNLFTDYYCVIDYTTSPLQCRGNSKLFHSPCQIQFAGNPSTHCWCCVFATSGFEHNQRFLASAFKDRWIISLYESTWSLSVSGIKKHSFLVHHQRNCSSNLMVPSEFTITGTLFHWVWQCEAIFYSSSEWTNQTLALDRAFLCSSPS